MNELWKNLCSRDALRRGWHLTHAEMKQDFVEEPYSKEIFAYFLDQNITEILRLLEGGECPNTTRSIPKGYLYASS